MQRSSIYLILACLTATGLTASTHNWYASVHGGLDLPTTYTNRTAEPEESINTKAGFGAGLALGRSFDQWRFELEGSFRRSSTHYLRDLSTLSQTSIPGKVQNILIMANARYSIPVHNQLDWELGAGVGYAHIDIDFDDDVVSSRNHGTGHTLAWQLITGPSWSINQQLSVGISYRLIGMTTTKIDFRDGDNHRHSDVFINSVEASIRYAF